MGGVGGWFPKKHGLIQASWPFSWSVMEYNDLKGIYEQVLTSSLYIATSGWGAKQETTCHFTSCGLRKSDCCTWRTMIISKPLSRSKIWSFTSHSEPSDSPVTLNLADRYYGSVELLSGGSR